jgi:autotransporter-associated beta strand protein
LYLGYSGSGSFTQSGGTNTVSSTFELGYSSSSSGTYNLNGGLLVLSSRGAVKGSGIAAFNFGGGTLGASTAWSSALNMNLTGVFGADTINTAGGNISLSGNLSGTGGLTKIGTGMLTLSGTNTYSGNTTVSGGSLMMSAGQLFSPIQYVGYAGIGSFAQSGGSNLVSDALYLGYTSSGTYTLSGGSLSAANEYLGFSGTGNFTQSGGTNAATGTLELGCNAGDRGIYNLNGGLLVLPAMGLTQGAGTAIFNFGGGTLGVSSPWSCLWNINLTGTGGPGTINTTGGNISISGNLSGGGGLTAFGTGVLTLTGSNTYTGNTTVNGGTLQVSNGGTDAASNTLYVGYSPGANGFYALNSGSLSASYEDIGVFGNGGFTQSGGTNTVSGGLEFANGSNGSGFYNLNGGLLVLGAGGVSKNVGSAAFNFGGGTLAASAAWSSAMNMNLTGVSGPAAINTTGGNISLSGNLTGPGGLTKIGANTLTLFGSNTYSGNTTISGGTLQLAQGLLSSPIQYVGYAGTGSLAQTGGTNSVSSSLYLGYTSSGSYTLSGGNLSAPSEYLGSSGTGNFTQSGGTNVVTSILELGCNAGDLGTYNLNRGLLVLPTSGLTVGSGSAAFNFGGGTLQVSAPWTWQSIIKLTGVGTVNTTGGSVYVPGGLSGSGLTKVGTGILTMAGSNSFSGITTVDGGTMQISGGWFSSPIQYVGCLLTGAFAQSGGTNSASNSLAIARDTGSTGFYSFSGGSLSAGTQYIGYSGSGSLSQTGGTNSMSSDLYVGFGIGGIGTYSLSGSGLLSVSNGEFIGTWGNGSFNQSGGTNLVTNAFTGYLFVGGSAGGTGTYNLSGSGLLSAQSEYVGSSGLGVFLQSGGTNSTTSLYISGTNGSYNLSGSGLLSISSSESFQGINPLFQQTGGTDTVGYLTLSGGRFLLAGGILQVSGLATNGGSLDCGSGSATIQANDAIVDLTGSIVNATSASLLVGPNSLVIVPPGFNPAVFRTYSNLGLTHTLGTTLNVLAGTGFSGWGTITDPVICQGSIIATASGVINLNSGLQLSGTGQVNVGFGALTVNDTASGMTSGSLSGESLIVGSTGTGAFTQSGGTNSVSGLTLGFAAGSSGSYTLTGSGLLSVPYNEYVGDSGSGNFTQTGGANSATDLLLGYRGSGTYNLGNGIVWAGTEYIGYAGASGVFAQTGGTHTVTSLMNGYGIGTSGSYSLSGSGLLAAGTEFLGDSSGSGSFTQTGGTHTVAALYLGYESGAGTYSLSGSGLLSAMSEQIQGSASLFQQTGGTNAAACVNLAGGRYLLSGGLLQINGGLETAGGTLNCGGGSASIQASNAIVDLTGSVINTASTSLSVGANSLVIVPSLSTTAAFGVWNNAGITHILGTTLTISSGTGFGGSGTITDPVICQGSIVATASGAINLTDGLQVSGTGQVSLGSGTLTINDSASGIGGGSLAAASLIVGSSGTGTFTQSGGTNWAGSIVLGQNAGSKGTYNLEGGLLNLAGLSKGSGSAALDYSSGTFQAASSFSINLPIVLNSAGSNVVFALSGDALTIASPLSGPGGLDEIGAGVLILEGSDSYGGETMVSGGTLDLLSRSALMAGSQLMVGANASEIFGVVVQHNSLPDSAQSVPEPGTLLLFAAGMAVLAGCGRRWRTSLLLPACQSNSTAPSTSATAKPLRRSRPASRRLPCR